MKKIMFMLVAAVVACAAQAASVDWSISAKSWTMSDGSKPNGATVYVFDTGAKGYTDFITALSAGTLGDSISDSTFTSAAGYLASGTSYSNSKAILLNTNYGKASGTATVSDADTKYTLAILVADGNNYFVSGTVDGLSYASNPDDGSSAMFTSVQMGAGSWSAYTAAGGGGSSGVPEPTSGLLLVLGGAMLALRRKQK